MAKIAFVIDPHTSDVAPLSRIDNYTEAILNKLRFIVDYANKHKLDAVVILGDLFHRKNPNLNSHDLVRTLIAIFQSCECPVYSIIGNHDYTTSYTNLKRQPIAVLHRAKALQIISYPQLSTFKAEFDNVDIYGLGHSENNEHFSETYI